MMLLRQRAGLHEFSDTPVAAPVIRALGVKPHFSDDAGMSVDAPNVCATLADGAAAESRIDATRGSPANPLSDTELEARLQSLCAYGKSGMEANRLIAAVWALDHCRDVSEIMSLAKLREQ